MADEKEQATQEFPDDYTVPYEVVAAVAKGILVDVSWHNDICPSFANNDGTNGEGYRLWVDHEDPKQREFPEWPRYRVSNDQGAEYEGEDIKQAIEALLELKRS